MGRRLVGYEQAVRVGAGKPPMDGDGLVDWKSGEREAPMEKLEKLDDLYVPLHTLKDGEKFSLVEGDSVYRVEKRGGLGAESFQGQMLVKKVV